MRLSQNRRVLLTGGTGFIGANLAQRLVADGHQVSLLIRDGADLVRVRPVEDRVKTYVADLLDARSVRQVLLKAEPEVVYHLASTPFNPPTIPPQTHIDVVVSGTLNLLEALADRPDTRVVYTGSGAEYGSGSRLNESSPLSPGTVLGAAKAAASILTQTYARLYGMQTVVLRLFTPYGRWEHPGRLIPHTILSALDGRDIAMSLGDQKRDYCYIDDVVEALVLAGTRPVPAGTVLNVCSGRPTAVRDIVELTLELMGNPVRALPGALPTRPDEIMEMSGDISAARRVLEWEPRVSLKDGLRETIAWFTKSRRSVEVPKPV